ncbi:DUF427 domain-containing protein [Devosia sp. XJ19-1]|uniref:DUF427 domain-containing protein n=1 Tax=Devosia ureilytica TaxID=2952754 RepID=A0A9Q4FU58_9HYPH|nr:DUF427 domain-containing protein [Devosia ureilytica]MCP8884724.1 DUF427 domain-containing protein [Devosia ureilytica]MCP8888355.1 DUF427 domain-containing protein [Devosia ureilytica]
MSELSPAVVKDDAFTIAFRGAYFVLHPSMRRVRGEFGGKVVADSEEAVLFVEFRDPRDRAREMTENKFWMGRCEYHWPIKDVDMSAFRANGRRRHDPRIGEGAYYDLVVDGRVITDAAWVWDAAEDDAEVLNTYIGIFSRALDGLYEEEDQITGPRNPYHAVEVRHSSRHVQVEVDGVIIADTTQSRILYETGLPPRYYFPRQDIRGQYLTRTDLRTTCPYKGECIYWSVKTEGDTRENLAWSYIHPYPNAGKIEHLISFYIERGATLIVDGQRLPAPGTPFPPGFIVKPTAKREGE